MVEKKTRWGMIGDFLREAAVLVLVFGFLDAVMPYVFGGPQQHDKGFLFGVGYLAVVILVSAVLLGFGIKCEEG